MFPGAVGQGYPPFVLRLKEEGTPRHAPTPCSATTAKNVVGAWSKAEDDAVMAKLAVVQEKLAKQGRLGLVARLLPATAATTLRKDSEPRLW